MGRGILENSPPRRHRNGQQIHEKMVNITSHHGNAKPH